MHTYVASCVNVTGKFVSCGGGAYIVSEILYLRIDVKAGNGSFILKSQCL